MRKLRIVSRRSPLAMWQAEWVKQALIERLPGLSVVIIGITTQGDKILDLPLAKIGGKGLFVKELESALIDKTADLAVHSIKDMAIEMPPSLCLAAITQRASPYDALISKKYSNFASLPPHALVGTSSLRRQSQLLAERPDLRVKPLRGNVATRLRKADEEFDAIVLAEAGLQRLKMADKIRHTLPFMLPAVGQGALGIQCREDNDWLIETLAKLNHRSSSICVLAERAMNATLQGGCQSPIAGFAEIRQQELCLNGLVAWPDGHQILRASATIPIQDADFIALGTQVGQSLLGQGAGKIFEMLKL